MAQTSQIIQLSDMRTLARRMADMERATTRYPDVEVTDYVNRGISYVYRRLVVIADQPFYQKQAVFTVVGANSQPATPASTIYPLAPDFLQILSVFWATTSAGPFSKLDPYNEAERYMFINAGYFGSVYPSCYGIIGDPGAFTQGTIPTAYSIEILPQAPAGSIINYRYVPRPYKLVNDTDTFDGILGFEDAACTWAAILMRRKDDLDTSDLERDMARHMGEIDAIGKRRDRRPKRIQIVRGRNNYGRRAFGYYPGR